MNDELYYSNFSLKAENYYFLYIGELKTICLCEFLQKGLERKLKKKVGFISIIQDICGSYHHNDLVVLNPAAQQMSLETDGAPIVAWRMPMRDFSLQVSQNAVVHDLVKSILKRQSELFAVMFENKPELTLPHVKLLGPDPNLVARCNDKSWQYDTFYGLVPTVDYKICCGCDELQDVTRKMRNACNEGIFVSHTYSAGGSHSMITQDQEQVEMRFNDPYARYLVSPFIPHCYDPTVLGVVANSRDVYIAGVADQRIEQGTGFRGSTFPSVLPENIQAELRQHTRTVGRKLGEIGFRGIFGCDYIVDSCDNVYFIEVNPRKQGTTMEFTCMLEQLFPRNAHSLMDLEYFAVTEGRFPSDTPWPDFGSTKTRNVVHWGTYNYKVNSTVRTYDFLQQATSERQLFKQCALHGKGGHLILEHVGRNVVVKPGTFLARVISVDKNHDVMLQRLEQGIHDIETTFSD